VSGRVAIRAERLGRRYGRRWALQDCTLDLPANRVIGLVGPNGAGKTTLLHLVVGLLRPTAGGVAVLGHSPGSKAALPHVGFVAQDKPLYQNFTVAQTMAMGGWLNPGWDAGLARRRLARLGIPSRQRVGKLSGGQRAQVALALALGKRPALLVLDEPVSSLDPLARREFLATLMEDVAETGCTVLLSSHLIADLERTCDYLVLLSAAQVQLAGDVEELVRSHLMLSGPRGNASQIQAAHTVIQAGYAGRQASLLVRTHGPVSGPAWTMRHVTLEELVLGYMSAAQEADPPPPLAAAAIREVTT
jgi:ABC-type multidrug transport system ATPase subunit